MPNKDKQRDHPSQPAAYAIQIKGYLGLEWADWFDGLSIEHDDDGDTRLCGEIRDQAALVGMLRKIHDLGLTIRAVVPLEPGDEPDAEPRE